MNHFYFSYKICLSHRLFCGLDNIYCAFMGSLNNLSKLIKQYGLSKATNEALFIIEAFRTLRDRGPFPADQVLKELEGSFGFVIYDNKNGTVFIASVRPFLNLHIRTVNVIFYNVTLKPLWCLYLHIKLSRIQMEGLGFSGVLQLMVL